MNKIIICQMCQTNAKKERHARLFQIREKDLTLFIFCLFHLAIIELSNVDHFGSIIFNQAVDG
jgi:lipopolysaccharide/colanic/teichoic acid biosynthesis glycosyltransferase